MRRNKYDIMLLSETNVNSSSWEAWDGYYCFFSSSIDPKVREKEMKRKEEKKSQASKDRTTTYTHFRNAPDFENAGVAIVIKGTLVDSLKDIKHINGRMMKATFAASGSDISFFAIYAPHSAHAGEEKENFYDSLSDEILQTKGTYYVGGDFNARLHYVRNVDKDVCGPHILGRGMAYLDGMSETTKESRALFLGFCKIHALKIMNTQFRKPPEKLLTYKEKCAQQEDNLDIGPPYDAHKYAQLDYWLAGDAWRSTIKDAQSRKDIFYDSDHFVLECRIMIKGLYHKTHNKERTVRFYKPNVERWKNYNMHIQHAIKRDSLCLQSLSALLQEAADKHLEKIPHDKKKSYISRGTWAKIEKRNLGRRHGMTSAELKQLNNDIAKSANMDKQASLMEKFNENPMDPNKKGLWKAVRSLKRKFTPQYVKMKNKHGKHVPLILRAETVASYLEEEHWKNDANGQPCRTKIVDNNFADESPFVISELNDALQAAKCHKQPGPDGIIIELLKWLDAPNRDTLLLLINSWWSNKTAPEELFLARVAPIFKKGDTDVASNYRPISLLNSVYKVYMMMIRTRMQNSIEHLLTRTQYGFRPSKSTSHAIYLIRRIQDFAESKAAKLSIALLDWEKAFDKIQHDKLLVALSRLGFSQHYIDVIADCYRKPTFYVKDDFATSTIKEQRSGIRQGCPLSPFLFTMVMSCIDSDIQSSITGHVANNRVPGLDFDMVYYADDTIVFSQSNRGLNELLCLTERISQQYGLHLNRDKCVAIPMNNDGSIHFQDGTPLATEYEATYLGNEINREVNIRHEISNKLQEVRRTWIKLTPYWQPMLARGGN